MCYSLQDLIGCVVGGRLAQHMCLAVDKMGIRWPETWSNEVRTVVCPSYLGQGQYRTMLYHKKQTTVIISLLCVKSKRVKVSIGLCSIKVS